MLAQTLARKFGVPYANQVDRLVAAISGGAARTPRAGATGEIAVGGRAGTPGPGLWAGEVGLARIHEQALASVVSPSYSPGTGDGLVKRAQETGS